MKFLSLLSVLFAMSTVSYCQSTSNSGGGSNSKNGSEVQSITQTQTKPCILSGVSDMCPPNTQVEALPQYGCKQYSERTGYPASNYFLESGTGLNSILYGAFDTQHDCETTKNLLAKEEPDPPRGVMLECTPVKDDNSNTGDFIAYGHGIDYVPRAAMIFVFGSNLAGIHGAGAAKTARLLYGARPGVGSGLQGESYAIPTKTAKLEPLPIGVIVYHIAVFTNFAIAHPEMEFKVTRVGCGLAGFTDKQLAPFFKHCPNNCQFDETWREYLPVNFKFWGTF